MEEIILYNSPLGVIQITCNEQSVLSVLFVETKKNNKAAAVQLINNFPVSLPPLAEQRRIVAKVDQLMALVDQLETQLAASRGAAKGLLEAVLAELTLQP